MVVAHQLTQGAEPPSRLLAIRSGRVEGSLAPRRPVIRHLPRQDRPRQWGCPHHGKPGSRRGGGWLAFAAQTGGQGSSAPQQVNDRRRFLLKYVQEVQPDIMETFVENAPTVVVDAFRQTLSNLLGNLPSRYFAVTISAMGIDLAQLMYSVMMSGYMFRNAHIRMELQQRMQPVLAPGQSKQGPDMETLETLQANAQSLAVSFQEAAAYEPGSQKTRVQGEVLRWHRTAGAEAVPAAQYIESLENQVEMLKQQVAAQMYLAASGNELLNYLRCLEHHSILELTSGAGEDCLEAVNSFIQRLLGTGDEDELRNKPSESSTVELSRLLFWLMVVGYNLRTLEVRFDMESTMLLPDPDLPGHSGFAPSR